jgi:hypothetical protein
VYHLDVDIYIAFLRNIFILSRSAEAIPSFRYESRRGEVSSVRQQSARDTAGTLAKVLKERFHASKVMLFGSVTRLTSVSVRISTFAISAVRSGVPY